MKKYLALTLFAFILLGSCSEKKSKIQDSAILAFYNVENLFDTINDPNTNDEDFLPEGRQKWDTKKYDHKLKNLSDVLLSIDSTEPPALIGLAEVENKEVLIDLIQNSKLKDYNYSIIHKNSPDFRGIDVALIYRSDYFQEISNNWINISFPFDSSYTTRDILYSKGKIFNDDIIHVFVNHWTSRYGGQEATTAKREFLGALLKAKSDSILKIEPNANIIIMGDLNDNPTDLSLTESLKSLPVSETILNDKLYNISLEEFQRGEGTLYYRSWDLFDQIIVSGALLDDENSLKLKHPDIQIHKPDWVLFEDNKGLKRPNRTASGGRYYGGYSDHLPVHCTVNKMD